MGLKLPPIGQAGVGPTSERIVGTRCWLIQGQNHRWADVDEIVLDSRLRRPPYPGLCPAALHASRIHASQSLLVQ